MSNVDVLPVEDERVVLDEAFEFEIPCDGPRIWPERFPDHSDPAKWIGFKTCGHNRLLCGQCKEVYLNLLAFDPAFSCAECGDPHLRGGRSKFLGFELINKARHS